MRRTVQCKNFLFLLHLCLRLRFCLDPFFCLVGIPFLSLSLSLLLLPSVSLVLHLVLLFFSLFISLRSLSFVEQQKKTMKNNNSNERKEKKKKKKKMKTKKKKRRRNCCRLNTRMRCERERLRYSAQSKSIVHLFLFFSSADFIRFSFQ